MGSQNENAVRWEKFLHVDGLMKISSNATEDKQPSWGCTMMPELCFRDYNAIVDKLVADGIAGTATDVDDKLLSMTLTAVRIYSEIGAETVRWAQVTGVVIELYKGEVKRRKLMRKVFSEEQMAVGG